jgi:S-adenosylmethionine:tRNA ribosyltransferase-isomerase
MSDTTSPDLDLLSSWSFELPEDHIARHPLAERTASRLLHLDKAGGLHHRAFADLEQLLEPGDVLVVNDTSVIPARLFGHKAQSGGAVEVLLVRRIDDGDWVVLLNASKKPKPGGRLVFPAGTLQTDALFATVIGPLDDEPGAFVVRFDGDALAYARAHGQMPLPPYMQRAPGADDATRYQTVFRDAAKEGSVAAPTAGLHFDEAMLQRLADKGVQRVPVTLHVGPGTFLPVRAERLSEHVMHPEAWWLPEETARVLNAARVAKKRIVAVGTTSARTLESARPHASVHQARPRRHGLRCPRHELPPARVDTARAGGHPRRASTHPRRLRRGHPRRLSLLQLRRRVLPRVVSQPRRLYRPHA